MIGYPLDSHVEFDENNIPVYDRAVSSVPLRKLIKKLFSDGVMPNPSTNMQVAAGTGMNVVVKPGFAICNGCMKLEEEQVARSVRVADSSYARIDTVVLRLDDNDSARSCELAVLTGTPSANPVRPNLTRNKSVWEIGLADIKVSANATSIKNGNITDTRYQASRCGVISSISEFDTTTLYQQIQDDLKEFQENEKTYFAEWFDEIKDQLSTDAAGNLQNQIIVERERINNLARMEEGSIVTDAEKEIADVRVDADGVVYPTAGDAVREQFNKAREQFDEVHDIRLGADGIVYPTAGEAVRAQFLKTTEGTVKRNETIIINTSNANIGYIFNTNGVVVGDIVPDINIPIISEGYFTYGSSIEKGDVFALAEGVNFRTNGEADRLLVVNENQVVEMVLYSTLNEMREYIFKTSGSLYVSTVIPYKHDDYFYLKKYNSNGKELINSILSDSAKSPLVLNSEYADRYLVSESDGDRVLDAILSGRQILVEVPNASGDNYVVSYSPIYMYQLPNHENDYLYLFYLKDEKQDFSAILGLPEGTAVMPTYGELKLLLSKKYNQTPLM